MRSSRARPDMRRGLIALALLLLAGCGTTAARPELVHVPLPPGLLSCAAEPQPPAKPYTQRDVALWLIDALDAGADCREKLREVGTLEAGRRREPTLFAPSPHALIICRPTARTSNMLPKRRVAICLHQRTGAGAD